MKRFFRIFLWFIIVYILVDFFTYYTIKSTYFNKEVEVSSDYPQIEITESKATVTNGYVKGKVTNNTELPLVDQYLKFELYSKKGELKDTKYIKINELQPGESQDFELTYNTDLVDHVKLSVVPLSELSNADPSSFNMDLKINNKTSFWIIFGAIWLIGAAM